MARKESGEGGGWERKLILKGLASGTSFCEGNRKPMKPFCPGSNEAALVC